MAGVAYGAGVAVESDPSALKIANDLSDLDSASAARTNLELGTAAEEDVGTGAGNVVQLDGGAALPAIDGSALTGVTDAGAQVQDDDLDEIAALSNVAGDILYTDATPEWARLAKGSDDDVLTLASGLPSWAAPAAGGGAGWPEAVVDGGDFSTVTAAITAGHTRILVTTDTTEDADWTLDASHTEVWIAEGVTVAMGASQIIGGAGEDLTLRGGVIAFAQTAGSAPLCLFDSGARFVAEGVTFDNGSSGGSNPIIYTSPPAEQIYLRCRILCPGLNVCGVYVHGGFGLVADCELVIANGDGNAITATTKSDLHIRGLYVTGVGSGANTISCGFASQVIFDCSSGDDQFWVYNRAEGIHNIGAGTLDISIRANDASIEQFSARHLTTGSTYTGVHVRNGRLSGAATPNLGAAGEFSNIFVAGDFSVQGDGSRAIGVRSGGGFTVSSGDNISVLGCSAGDTTGTGGSDTISVSGGVTGASIVGCHTDVAISDSGTGTEFAANYVY